MSAAARLAWLLLPLGLGLACKREAEPDDEARRAPPASTMASAAPRRLYVPDDFDRPASVAAPKPRCPEEMVLVRGSYCVDRYEVSLIDQLGARALSPHYPPSRHYVAQLYERFSKIPTRRVEPFSQLSPVPPPPDFQLTEDFEPKAVARPGVLPAGYLSRGSAAAACARADKRLCTREEWVAACRGERDEDFPYGPHYEDGACNVHRHNHPAQLLHGDASKYHLDPRLGLAQDEQGPLLRPTGATARCRSAWGEDALFDMVGNVDEWIDDADGTFLGGFYSRGTKLGCAAAIELHGPEYLDYSLGTRCCRDAEAPR